MRRDSQYQLEKVQDWATHLKHLQSIFFQFDAAGAPAETAFIRFFWEGLKPSVKAQIKQQGQEFDSWDKLIEKTIDVEAKASLQPVSIIWEMNQ